MSNNTTTTPPENPHTTAAQALIDELRAMRERIPNFAFPASPLETRRLTRSAAVPAPFIELSAVAVKNSPALVRGGGADPAQLRDLITFADAYAPFVAELKALTVFVSHTVTAARNKAGSDALTTFALARRMAKRPETADLQPQVESMRRALGAPRRKPKAPEGEPKPASEPAPEPTS